MAKKFYQASRMCISCRTRDIQQNMLRLQCIDGNIEIFKGLGRTFYLCNDCLEDEKKLLRSLMRQCKSSDKEKLMNKLKEIITDDR